MCRALCFLALSGLLLTPGFGVQDPPAGPPMALAVKIEGQPNPNYVAGKPAYLVIQAVGRSGMPSPINGDAVVVKTTDPRNRLNGREAGFVNGKIVLKLQWFTPSPQGGHTIEVASKSGLEGGASGIRVDPLPKGTKLSIEDPKPWARYVWSGGMFHLRVKATDQNDDPVEHVEVSLKLSKGARAFPHGYYTEDGTGIASGVIFPPEYICRAGKGGGESVNGDAPLKLQAFIDVNGNGDIDDGEPIVEPPPPDLVSSCPQVLLPAALELLRILEEGGTLEPPPEDDVIVVGVASAGSGGGKGKAVGKNKPDTLTDRELAKIRAARRFLEDEVIGFVNSGKWNGKFSQVRDRLKRPELVVLRDIAAAEPVVQRLECAAKLMEGAPDVKRQNLDVQERPGSRIEVLVGSESRFEVQNLTAGNRPASPDKFPDCFKPGVVQATTQGNGSATIPDTDQPFVEFECLGRGNVLLTTTTEFKPVSVVVLPPPDNGVVAASKVIGAAQEDDLLTLAFRLVTGFRIEQNPCTIGSVRLTTSGVAPSQAEFKRDDPVGGRVFCARVGRPIRIGAVRNDSRNVEWFLEPDKGAQWEIEGMTGTASPSTETLSLDAKPPKGVALSSEFTIVPRSPRLITVMAFCDDDDAGGTTETANTPPATPEKRAARTSENGDGMVVRIAVVDVRFVEFDSGDTDVLRIALWEGPDGTLFSADDAFLFGPKDIAPGGQIRDGREGRSNFLDAPRADSAIGNLLFPERFVVEIRSAELNRDPDVPDTFSVRLGTSRDDPTGITLTEASLEDPPAPAKNTGRFVSEPLILVSGDIDDRHRFASAANPEGVADDAAGDRTHKALPGDNVTVQFQEPITGALCSALARVFPEPDAEDPLARRTVECEVDVLNAGALAAAQLTDAQMAQGAQDQIRKMGEIWAQAGVRVEKVKGPERVQAVNNTLLAEGLRSTEAFEIVLRLRLPGRAERRFRFKFPAGVSGAAIALTIAEEVDKRIDDPVKSFIVNLSPVLRQGMVVFKPGSNAFIAVDDSSEVTLAEIRFEVVRIDATNGILVQEGPEGAALAANYATRGKDVMKLFFVHEIEDLERLGKEIAGFATQRLRGEDYTNIGWLTARTIVGTQGEFWDGGRIGAHELGHLLGLQHFEDERNNWRNLMGTPPKQFLFESVNQSRRLTSAQVRVARTADVGRELLKKR
jgi:hypothetical protein